MEEKGLVISRPTKDDLLTTLIEMKEPSVYFPGIISVVILFIFGLHILPGLATVAISLYIHKLWNRLKK